MLTIYPTPFMQRAYTESPRSKIQPPFSPHKRRCLWHCRLFVRRKLSPCRLCCHGCLWPPPALRPLSHLRPLRLPQPAWPSNDSWLGNFSFLQLGLDRAQHSHVSRPRHVGIEEVWVWSTAEKAPPVPKHLGSTCGGGEVRSLGRCLL